MPTTTGFRDVDNAVALDIATKFVTKEYLMEFYPDLVPAALTPRLLLWGNNFSGQLGTNNTSNYSSPVETVSGGTNWARVSSCCSSSHTAAIKTDGTLWTWGNNTYGQLGNSVVTSPRSSPITTSGGGTNWKQVACGYFHTAAVKTDGTLWTWGNNAYGQLGNSVSASSRSSPITTSGGGTNWKQVACGFQTTAAVKTDGTLWCWGAGTFGQVGDNTSSNRSSPVTTAGGGTTWKQVSGGQRHTAAIKTDGTLWTWGRNAEGQLGDNTLVSKSSPVTTVAGGTNWKQVGCGNFHTAAVKTDGTLWSWGQNTYGNLGDNTSSNRSSPVTTVAGGTNWKKVECTEGTAAIKTDGTLWTWGDNTNGGLGDGTTTSRSSPATTLAGGTNWKEIGSAGGNFLATQESEGW